MIPVRADWTALPLVFMAAALVAGEVCGFALHRYCGLCGWAALIAVVCASAAIGWRIRRAVYPVAFVAGMALAWRGEVKRTALDEYAKTVPEGGGAPVFTVEARSDGVRGRGRKGVRRMSFDTRIGSIPVKVVAPMPEDGRLPMDGERWRCSGWLSLKKDSVSRYSRRTLWVTADTPPEKTADAQGISAGKMYRRLSETLSRRLGEGLEWSPASAAFGKAMLLGRREGIPRGKLASFAVAGTVHVFAISGLHVMLVAGMLGKVLKTAGVSLKLRAVLVIPALAAYVMLIGSPPSAVRAALMTSLYLGASLFGRKPDSLAAWGIAAILICAYDPSMVMNTGCVFSFTVMLGIVLWLRWSARFASPADALLKLAARESAFGCAERKVVCLWLYGKLSWILGGLGISFAAWIAGVPVAARVFGRLAPCGIFLNLAVVPLAGMAVAFGVFGLIAAFAAPQIGLLFKHLAALCIFLMSWLSEKSAGVPCSSVETLPWSLRDCVMWYVAWIAFFMFLSRHLPLKEHVTVREWENCYD